MLFNPTDVWSTQRTAIICLCLECPGSREVCSLKCRQGEEDNTRLRRQVVPTSCWAMRVASMLIVSIRKNQNLTSFAERNR